MERSGTQRDASRHDTDACRAPTSARRRRPPPEAGRARSAPAPPSEPPASAAAAMPGGAHVAPPRSAANRTAPDEAESRVAAVAEASGDAVTTGAGIAGMAGPAGVARPGERGEAGAAPPARAPRERAVLHVDIDAFFAAIEQQRDPRLRGRPVIVGAGVIASCSYEARRFGLRAGMRLSEARRRCPGVVILEGHAQVYRCFAEDIFARCRAIAPAIETFLDEAYCDLTGTERLHGDLTATAAALKADIRAATGLTVTCGLGPNRMLAKLAGKTVKPDGLARVTAAEADAFLRDRPIGQLPGVGPAHARTLRSMNLATIGALRALSPEVLEALFGAPGRLLHERCRGRDTAPVTEREVPRTISRETSFHRDTADGAEIEGMLEYLVGRACRTTRELSLQARTVAVRLRYADDEGGEQARTLRRPTHADPVVLECALDLLRRQFTRRVALHSVGVTLSQFVRDAGEQGALFDEAEAGRRDALYRAFDGVRSAHGHGALVSGRALHLKGRVTEDRHGFVLRTPSLTK